MSDVASDDTAASPEGMDDVSDASDPLPPAIPVPRDSVWTTTGNPPLFPPPGDRDDINHAKRLLGHKASVFPGLGYKRQVDVTMFPPTQAHYPSIASHNLYEWIATGSKTDPIAPDLDIYVQDTEASTAKKKTVFCGSQIETTRAALSATEAIRRQWEVEAMTLDEVCVFLQSYTHDFSKDEDMDSVLGRLREQPCYHRPFSTLTISCSSPRLRRMPCIALFVRNRSMVLHPTCPIRSDYVSFSATMSLIRQFSCYSNTWIRTKKCFGDNFVWRRSISVYKYWRPAYTWTQ